MHGTAIHNGGQENDVGGDDEAMILVSIMVKMIVRMILIVVNMSETIAVIVMMLARCKHLTS